MSWLSDVLGGSMFDSCPGECLFPEICSFLQSLLVNARLVPLTRPQQFSISAENQVMQRITLPLFWKSVNPGGKLINYSYN
jgi:hypothetical protein